MLLAAGVWLPTGSMLEPRVLHTATRLPDGRVLVAGGSADHGELASAELYDPSSGSWTATGAMTEARAHHTATLLPTGLVLVAGGYRQSDQRKLASAELYDPATGTWTATASMAEGRWQHTATLLPDGRVLVAGGFRTSNIRTSASAEVYDPTRGTWSATGDMKEARAGHTATLLPDGQVLVAAGQNPGYGKIGPIASAELYDPADGTWSLTGSLAGAREGHTATLLSDGHVLVAGGFNGADTAPQYVDTAELYDSAAGSWTATDHMVIGRSGHTATLLPTGEVLVVGGNADGMGYLSSAEFYDHLVPAWFGTVSMLATRVGHTATLLVDGSVLVAGGSSEGDGDPPGRVVDTSELCATGCLPDTAMTEP